MRTDEELKQQPEVNKVAENAVVEQQSPADSPTADRNPTPVDLLVAVRRTRYGALFPDAQTQVKFGGEVLFTDEKNASRKEVIAGEVVDQIWQEVQKAGFFEFADEYRMRAYDIPTTVITVRANGIRKKVLNQWVGMRGNVGFPNGVNIEKHEAVDALAIKIEQLAGMRWLLKWF